MTINSASILQLRDQRTTQFPLLLANGNRCREITALELRRLALNGYVQARVKKNGEVASVRLLVPANVAFPESPISTDYELIQKSSSADAMPGGLANSNHRFSSNRSRA